MYHDFYQLHKNPFHITPNPEFLFFGKNHRKVYDRLLQGISSRKTCMTVVGDAGVGKTLMARALLQHIDPQECQAICLEFSSISFTDLVLALLYELAIEAKTDALDVLLLQLHSALMVVHQQGRRLVLFIDEAQSMPVETLQQLGYLMHAVGCGGTYLQVVLLGQPALRKTLRLSAVRLLRRGIEAHLTLLPLSKDQCYAYIRHRLAHAASTAEPIFTRAALRCIVRSAKGYPTTLNVLCELALEAGFENREKPISVATVQAVLHMRGISRSFSLR